MVESKVVKRRVLGRKKDSSCEATKRLPDELVAEILSWLPAQHLWPLRCMNKTWFKLLTTDRLFAKLHAEKSIKSNCNPSILAVLWDINRDILPEFYLAMDYASVDKAISLYLPFHNPDSSWPSYDVWGICNGLVCVADHDSKEVYIWNPLTKDHITIPNSPDPPNEDVICGFGLHQESEEYKVIKIVNKDEFGLSDHHAYISVWTVGVDSSWRILELEEDFRCIMGKGNINVLVNGALHWLGSMSGTFFEDRVVAFDLKEEVFREMTFPNDVDFHVKCYFPKIGELGGLLCLHGLYGEGGVQIWVMKEYGAINPWTKWFRIEGPEGCVDLKYLQPLGIVAHNGEVIVKINCKELILYNPKTNSISEPKYLDFWCYGAYMFMFVPNIISPKVISGSGQSVQ